MKILGKNHNLKYQTEMMNINWMKKMRKYSGEGRKS